MDEMVVIADLSVYYGVGPGFLVSDRLCDISCDENHHGCRRRSGKENFWPKRAIFIGNPDKLTLVEKLHQEEDYLVLSHCWGPLTDQDKKRFFQIDALYIIQEGPDCDWKTEAKNMANIFAYAYCTISASSARGWGDGFLKLQSDPPNIRVQDTPKRVLSRRIIHFTAAHTYCECGDGVLCERLTKLKPPFRRQYFILDPNFPTRLGSSGFNTDRDVAIYSLLERMEQALKTEERTHENKTRPIPYKDRTVPSWSWMAYPGGIGFIADATKDHTVLRRMDLGFTKDGEALNVKVRKFGGDCRSLSFDVADQIQLKDCNCIEDARKTYYVLVIRKKGWRRRYKRVGVGKVEAHYVSRECVPGTLR
ncbi:hypothetical protein B0T18DRAFT_440491 [Schizothecium vesticola]|uniref:Heterokaryon incompatibility domain-containing protein n=1 Tax=Schizothecium vesticola TaxID=314040 RepID=A0AA40EKM1_9PEZI|nr:hypothetical protein B0T18DRAFT_440491 [Schizothecium vesticola]